MNRYANSLRHVRKSKELIAIPKMVISNKISRAKDGGVNSNSPLLHATSAFLNGVSEHRHRS